MLRLLPVSYHQPLPPHVHRFLADRSLGTFYDAGEREAALILQALLGTAVMRNLTPDARWRP